MMIQTDKAIMWCNGRFYWAIATIGFVAASTTAFGALTQAEVDRIVDNEIIMCEHEEDAAAIEKSLKERGATGEMLAHGYYFVMEKTKNAEKGSLDSEKFHSAAFGFANVARIERPHGVDKWRYKKITTGSHTFEELREFCEEDCLDYNTYRPHSMLDNMTPVEFLQSLEGYKNACPDFSVLY